MKKIVIKKIYVAAMMALTLSACDDGFEELNTNPDASSEIVPEYMFSTSQVDAARNILGGAMGTMQYTTSFNDVAGFGSKYIFNQGQAPYTVFNNAYIREINELGEVIRAVSNNPAFINKLATARIWRVYSYHRITDLYGDVPYFKAGLGYQEANYKPEYDSQEAIYKDMLKELEESLQSFDPALATFGVADVVYGGNVDKWKKFGYSLMLRLGMRLTKVDAALAKTWVEKAVAGGVITQDADIAMIKYTTAGQVINQNPLAYNLLNSDYLQANGNTNPEGGKYQENFINYLKANKDPRLGVISVVYVNGKADTSFAVQKGMAATFRNTKPADFITYSEPNQQTLLKLDSPILLLTSAEVNLLLAEAAIRGWYNGLPATLFENGIRAGLKQWALYGSAGVISDANTNAYLAQHPFNAGGTFEEKMEQIHTQFWVSVFPDAQEVFANWRRTGYPVLVPNVVPGNSTGGEIFRRMLYPPTEENLNNDQFQKAITRQGPNTFLTRVWWDKQ